MKYLKVPKEFKGVEGGVVVYRDTSKNVDIIPDFCSILKLSLFNFPRSSLNMEASALGAIIIDKLNKYDENKDEFIQLEDAEYQWLTESLKVAMPLTWAFNAKILYDLFTNSSMEEKDYNKYMREKKTQEKPEE